mgnify:CR=1 FL=1
MWNIFFQQLVGQTTYNIMATVSGVGGSTSIHILATVSGTGKQRQLRAGSSRACMSMDLRLYLSRVLGRCALSAHMERWSTCTLRAIGKRPSHPSLAPSAASCRNASVCAQRTLLRACPAPTNVRTGVGTGTPCRPVCRRPPARPCLL